MMPQLVHWLLFCKRDLQQEYIESRVKWRRDHNIPDKMNVKGSNVIPSYTRLD